MPTPDDEKFDSPDLHGASVSNGASSPADDDEDIQIPAPSEVATRINLLGKLIVPPTPR